MITVIIISVWAAVLQLLWWFSGEGNRPGDVDKVRSCGVGRAVIYFLPPLRGASIVNL